ncbi:metallophosphoesterase [Waterburya agarophytonicola K14]|uniref:Metallophosphoesterase n=1 Tax=Waterburya agarophytonicola KI4 TaxID=2874699 RepID=A0A964BQE8_9CYAN|nr:metallophosphoesterase [Waterburya agarophytonicola]MCC0177679.1 metallophosphoesterase [Waterburya agarophytonicola KI4]
MKFAFDPPISDKIARMQQRVRWQDEAFRIRKIDQTQLNIDDRQGNNSEFSFLVVGDTGCNGNKQYSPQQQVAQLMLQHQNEVSFILHTGDVVYEVGSKEYYPQNFIHPYQEFIVSNKMPPPTPYDRITFKIPFLLVPGNHDYYNLSLPQSILAQVAKSLRWLKRSGSNLNLGLFGSDVGEIYAKAFLDYTADLTTEELAHHLDRHYTAKFQDSLCLNYQPHRFTRLPNRYYSFRYGNLDFIALDSNTFNTPVPIADTPEGAKLREQLIAQLETLDRQYEQLKSNSQKLDLGNPFQQDLMNDYQLKLHQISDKQKNIHQKLQAEDISFDYEQLNWFKNKLISSWSDSTVRGRILYFHHSPYVTESTKYQLEETLKVRHHLRQILNQVTQTLKGYNQSRPLLDLVISGHAHCFEHLYTFDTGYADSDINWLICGAGGHSVRRQRLEGGILTEIQGAKTREVARSRLFLGCKGHGIYKKRPYSCLRIDVGGENRSQFQIRPLVAEQAYQNWYHYQPDSFAIG